MLLYEYNFAYILNVFIKSNIETETWLQNSNGNLQLKETVFKTYTCKIF